MAETQDVRDNEGESRYELKVDGGTAIAAYERRDGALVFTHTQVPEAGRARHCQQANCRRVGGRAGKGIEGRAAMRIRCRLC